MTRRSILILPVATLLAACSTDEVRVTGVPDQASRAVTPINPNGYTATVLRIDKPYAMNDAGAVVGETNNDPTGAYYQSGSTFVVMPMINGAKRVVPLDINNQGQITGWIQDAYNNIVAVYWPSFRSMPFAIGDLGGGFAAAHALNDSGYVVGVSRVPAATSHAFLWRAGSILANISPTYPGTWASAINERGDVAGGTKLNGVTLPYARRDGINSRLTTRPDVHGTGITPAGSVILSSGEYWLRSGAITRPHPTNFYPVKVSSSGRVVGYSSAMVNGAEVRTATTRHAGTMVSLRTALEASSEAIDVTSCGSVLARATAVNGTLTGVLWTKATCDVAAPIP